MVCHQPVIPAKVAQPQPAQVERQLITQPLPAARPEGGAVPAVAAKQLVRPVAQQDHSSFGATARRCQVQAPKLLVWPLLVLLHRRRRRGCCYGCSAARLRTLPSRWALDLGWQQGPRAAGSQPESRPDVEVHHSVCRGQQAQQAGPRRLDVCQRAVHLGSSQGAGRRDG